MSKFVVEPAVVVKWFVPEDFSSQSARLLDGGVEIMAPDTISTETAGIVTAKIRLDEISEEEGMVILEALEALPVLIRSVGSLIQPALAIATSFDIPFRHGLNLAFAVQEECRLVTANRTLYDRVQGTPFAVHAKWVGDLR